MTINHVNTSDNRPLDISWLTVCVVCKLVVGPVLRRQLRHGIRTNFLICSSKPLCAIMPPVTLLIGRITGFACPSVCMSHTTFWITLNQNLCESSPGLKGVKDVQLSFLWEARHRATETSPAIWNQTLLGLSATRQWWTRSVLTPPRPVLDLLDSKG